MDHVVHEENFDNETILYYISQLFALSLYYNIPVKVFINDLLKYLPLSQKLSCIYQDNTLWFFKNHPINKICIQGLCIGLKEKLISKQDFFILTIDDCTGLIKCKCAKKILNDPSFDQAIGINLEITGILSLSTGEVEIETLKQIPTLVEEIKFWEACISIKNNLKKPWTIDKKLVTNFYTQESQGNNNFIQQLEQRYDLYNLKISGPCLNNNHRNHKKYLSSSEKCMLPNNSEQLGDNMYIIKEISQNKNRCSPRPWTLKQYKQLLLRWLISQPSGEYGINELYKDSRLSRALELISQGRFHQQYTHKLKCIDQIKLEIFSDVLTQFYEMELLMLNSNNEMINSTNLHFLNSCIKNKISTLIELKITLGRIYYQNIRETTNLVKVNEWIITSLVKICLEESTKNILKRLKDWFLETYHNFILINFRYSEHDQNIDRIAPNKI